MKNSLKASAVFALLLAATPVFAATDTGSITVTAVVKAYCTVSDGSVDLGNIQPGVDENEISATGNIDVQCTKGTTYGLSIDDATLTGALTQDSFVATMTVGDLTPQTVYAASFPTSSFTGNGFGANTTIVHKVKASVLKDVYENKKADEYTGTTTVTVTY